MPRLTDEQREELTKLRAERDALRGALAMGKPWPLRDVLDRLVIAAEHLLGDHCCDGHGYEGLLQAIDAARSIRLTIDRALAPPPEPPKPAGADAVPSGDAGERRAIMRHVHECAIEYEEHPRCVCECGMSRPNCDGDAIWEVLPGEPVKGE
jgi:hypothetical protein